MCVCKYLIIYMCACIYICIHIHTRCQAERPSSTSNTSSNNACISYLQLYQNQAQAACKAMKHLSFSSGRYKNDVLNVRPAGRPRKTHGTSAGRRAQPVTEWTKIGLFLGGRLRSSTDCQQMGVPS